MLYSVFITMEKVSDFSLFSSCTIYDKYVTILHFPFTWFTFTHCCRRFAYFPSALWKCENGGYLGVAKRTRLSCAVASNWVSIMPHRWLRKSTCGTCQLSSFYSFPTFSSLLMGESIVGLFSPPPLKKKGLCHIQY